MGVGRVRGGCGPKFNSTQSERNKAELDWVVMEGFVIRLWVQRSCQRCGADGRAS